MRKRLKMAGAGEFRGEGSWIPVMGAEMERDFDHCKRTGKQCVLVDQPQAMHFVRKEALAAF